MHIQNKQRETRHGFYTKSLPSSLSYLQVLKTETMRFRVGTNVVYCVPALFPLLFAVLLVLIPISSIGGPFNCASGRPKREIGRDDTSLPPLCYGGKVLQQSVESIHTNHVIHGSMGSFVDDALRAAPASLSYRTSLMATTDTVSHTKQDRNSVRELF